MKRYDLYLDAFDAPRKPRLLDLFCGAGGAAMGYSRAGFDVVGVDINPQPNYPFEFHQADAMEFMHGLLYGDGIGSSSGRLTLSMFDAIHASPPCQRYSAMSSSRPGLADDYPDLVVDVRHLLQAAGLPYVVENVEGSPLDGITLCGQMFGLDLYRHRVFESSSFMLAPGHPGHVIPASRAGHYEPGTIISVAGHVSPMSVARQAMGIDWMTRDELSEAIPPAYTEHIGRELLQAIEVAA